MYGISPLNMVNKGLYFISPNVTENGFSDVI